jgi:hypothetical protein
MAQEADVHSSVKEQSKGAFRSILRRPAEEEIVHVDEQPDSPRAVRKNPNIPIPKLRTEPTTIEAGPPTVGYGLSPK